MVPYLYEMSVKANNMKAALNAKDLATWLRSERKAQGRSQAWIAAGVGCRRQTIVDLEAGRNVELNALFGALAALGKGLAIVDARVDVERLNEVFHDED
jgi:DNA-binding XRE family transcriptional regulator